MAVNIRKPGHSRKSACYEQRLCPTFRLTNIPRHGGGRRFGSWQCHLGPELGTTCSSRPGAVLSRPSTPRTFSLSPRLQGNPRHPTGPTGAEQCNTERTLSHRVRSGSVGSARAWASLGGKRPRRGSCPRSGDSGEQQAAVCGGDHGGGARQGGGGGEAGPPGGATRGSHPTARARAAAVEPWVRGEPVLRPKVLTAPRSRSPDKERLRRERTVHTEEPTNHAAGQNRQAGTQRSSQPEQGALAAQVLDLH